MDEVEWLACDQPQAMLDSLPDGVSGRKLRLFACACCYRVSHMAMDERSRRIVDLAEMYADGEVGRERVDQASDPAWQAYMTGDGAALHARLAAFLAADSSPAFAAREAASAAEAATFCDPDDPEVEDQVQAALLHCIFGNPFRPVALDPSWRTSTVVALAEGIYADRAFDRLPILADALQDAGCDNEDLLAHLRGDGPHVRGCWALDLILGKE